MKLKNKITDNVLRTIEILSTTVNQTNKKIKWEALPNDWFLKIRKPENIQDEDFETLYRYEMVKTPHGTLFAIVGKYYNRYYYDSDKFIRDSDYFISYFLIDNDKAKKGKMVLNSQLNEYFLELESRKTKKLENIKLNLIEGIYENAQDTNLELDEILEDFIFEFKEDENEEQ